MASVTDHSAGRRICSGWLGATGSVAGAAGGVSVAVTMMGGILAVRCPIWQRL